MLTKRTKQDVLREAIESITEYTDITNLHAGSIGRSILESVSGVFEELYEVAEFVLHQGFLSRAEGEYLDLIGELFNYERREESVVDQETGEYVAQKIDDKTFRFELSKQIQVAVSSNEEAVRLSLLKISGVQNIEGIEYSHGSGSFSYILTVQAGFDEEAVYSEVVAAVDNIKAYGVRAEILLPEHVPVELQVQLILKGSPLDSQSIKHKVQTEITNYFGNFRTGQNLVYNDLVQVIMSSDEDILDFHVKQFAIDGYPVLLMNHEVLNTERFRPKMIDVI